MNPHLNEILAQARRGIHQTPTYPGLRHPAIKGSLDKATCKVEKIERYAKQHPDFNWVSVAIKDISILIDVDYATTARSMGMPIPEDTFLVRTPRGGLHIYLWWTPACAGLKNCDIYHEGKLVVEVKMNRKTCASPGVHRTDSEPQGWYEPLNDHEVQPIRQDLIDWIKAHTDKREVSYKKKLEYHPEFEYQDWIDHYDLVWTGKSKVVNSVEYWGLGSCPFIGRPHTNAKWDCTCVVWGNRIGISCLGCSDKGIQDFRELMEDEDIEDYPYYVYKFEDPALCVNKRIANLFEVEEL